MNYAFPDKWFEFLAAKGIFWIFACLAFSFYALCKGSDLFVDGAAGVAKKLGIPTIIIGVTIVSLGTTSPEATVSIMAAAAGKSGFALGNAIGSIISNTALIFGLGCTLTYIPTDRYVFKRQGIVLFVSCFAFALLCYVLHFLNYHYVPRLFGFCLLAALVGYILKSAKWAKEHQQAGIIDEEHIQAKKSIPALALIFISGLAIVVITSRVLIASATQICIRFGIPDDVIAATIVAFGTSVPELATGMAGIIKGHKEILLGNIIGANILNIFVVIGASASVAGLKVTHDFYYFHFPFLILVIGLFTLFSAISKDYYRRVFGPILIVIYISYILTQYLLR